MIWNLFRKPKRRAVELPDHIWMTEERATGAVAFELLQWLGRGQSAVGMVQLSSRLPALQQCLRDADQEFTALDGDLRASEVLSQINATDRPAIYLAMAEQLIVDADPFSNESDATSATSVGVVVRERHLLSSGDEKILDFASQLGNKPQIRFHLSLTDRLLSEMANEHVMNMLRKLGLEESGHIESRMVSRRIQATQKELEAAVDTPETRQQLRDWKQADS